MPWTATLAFVFCALLGLGRSAAKETKTIHTVFTTECNQYFNWQVREAAGMTAPFSQGNQAPGRARVSSALQALAMYHSYKKSGQKGPITRLVSCTEEQLKYYKDIDGVPTHFAPSWSVHPRTGDLYRQASRHIPTPPQRTIKKGCGVIVSLVQWDKQACGGQRLAGEGQSARGLHSHHRLRYNHARAF